MEALEQAVSRRGLLRAGAAGGLGILVSGSVGAIADPTAAAAGSATRAAGFGALVPDPAGVLALPPGFSYQVIAQAGQTLLDSGEPTPSDPDGTAVFRNGRAGFVLVNNHEIGGSEPYGVPALPGLTFDPGARGGTTTIVVDADGKRVREYVSLAGTHNNCAGGVTPWGTWLTCEETEQRKGGVYQQDHGWCFDVDPFDQAANQDPVALKFLGRYSHEAIAIDPETHEIYLTEDASGPHGLYYRWVPPKRWKGGKGALRALQLSQGDNAGTLQAMSCSKGGRHVKDLSEATQVGTRYKVTWVDVPDRLATTTSVRKQLTADQVTGSRKLEGAYWGDGGAYFVASFARVSDGSVNEHDGQVWFYDPATETVTLTTIFGVNPDPDVDAGSYDGPDNIVVDPHGGLILAEDGEGVQHLVGVTAEGKTYPMARNDVSGSEFTGPTFTPDGRILFANIQEDGYVFAITGPWRS